MNAIIVDDEPRAIELLKSYLQHFDAIELSATFRNGLKAFDYLKKHPVDLVFLDINMPDISGLSLSQMIASETKIIFTTAHAEFAVDSYDVQALDYLLKPISLERFTKAIGKALQAQQKKAAATLNLKSGPENHIVNIDDILYLQKDGNYMIYRTAGQEILARESTARALENLPWWFRRIHKSYIVNTRKISSYSSSHVMIGKSKLPVGESFREAFLQSLPGGEL